MESLNFNSQERELYQLKQMQDNAKESCMVSFRLLHSHLKSLSNNDLKGTCIEAGFERAFATLFDQDFQSFTGSMLLNLDQLGKQLDKEEYHEIGSMDAFRMQSKEGKVDSSKALDAGLVVTESNETELERHVSSSRSGNDTHAEDDDIKPVNDNEPIAETVENAELKAQIQEKVFANVALKNELRKLKGNSMDTKFAKPSILGKLPRFASQVDVNNILSKPVTPRYLPKVREFVFAKPHHVIAPGSFRNSSKESYGSNDMAHNYYLEEAKKKTQDTNMNLKPRVMHTTSLQNTTNGSKPKPRSNNQTSRSLPVSKSSCGMSNGVPLVDHSRNSSSFSDSKHFVCSTCKKYVFNANHDACLTKFPKEVNSRIKVQSSKTRNNIKPVEKINNVIKPKRWISKGYRISPNKTSVVHEKPNTPRSCLRWKPTSRIFKTASLRWIPTGNMFTDSTTMVDNEPLNGSNEDEQTLNVSASTFNLSAGTSFNPKEERLRVWLLKKLMTKNQVPQGIHKHEQSPNSAQGVKEQQQRAYFDDPCHQLLHKAMLLKEKKDVRFSALYLKKKRNLLIFDHSHKQSS
ncbi:hypothetical protein Tco_0526756 [Tanacetum coccineum]